MIDFEHYRNDDDAGQEAYEESLRNRTPAEPITEQEWEAAVAKIEAMGIEVER